MIWRSSADHTSAASAGLNWSTRARNAARLAASSSEGISGLDLPQTLQKLDNFSVVFIMF